MLKFKNLFLVIVLLLTFVSCAKNRPYSSRPTLTLATEYDEETSRDLLIINFSETVSQNIRVEFDITNDDGIKVINANTVYIPAWTYIARISFSTVWVGSIPSDETYVTVKLVRAGGVCGECYIGEPNSVKVRVR